VIDKLIVGAADKSVNGPPVTLANGALAILAGSLAAVGAAKSPEITRTASIILFIWISYLKVMGK
jgi:hypothetical protein